MGEGRWLEPQHTVEVYLLRGRKEKVGTSHYLPHSHKGVVDNHGQLICPCAIGTTQYEIAALCGPKTTSEYTISSSGTYMRVACGRCGTQPDGNDDGRHVPAYTTRPSD